MKKIVFLLLTYCFACSYQGHALVETNKTFNHDFFSLSTTSTWKEYRLHVAHSSLDKKKWAWACSLTLRSKQPIKLTTLTLKWQGLPLTHLAASLYQKKEREHSVIPIEQNLVCEGKWNAQQQQLVFTLDEKIVAVNKYHLLLSFPNKLEHRVKSGSFVVEKMETRELCKKD